MIAFPAREGMKTRENTHGAILRGELIPFTSYFVIKPVLSENSIVPIVAAGAFTNEYFI